MVCPLSDILLWVRIWVKRLSADLQNFTSNFSVPKTQEKVLKSYDFRTFYGCGGRTRTYELRVMRACFELKKLENNGKIMNNCEKMSMNIK